MKILIGLLLMTGCGANFQAPDSTTTTNPREPEEDVNEEGEETEEEIVPSIPDESQWKEVRVEAIQGEGSLSHLKSIKNARTFSIEDYLFLLGGEDNTGDTSPYIYRYSIKQNSWSAQKQPLGDNTSFLAEEISIAGAEGAVYLYQCDGSECFLSKISITANGYQNTKLWGGGATEDETTPGARKQAVLYVVEGEVRLTGGTVDESPRSDVWAFDLDSALWSKTGEDWGEVIGGESRGVGGAVSVLSYTEGRTSLYKLGTSWEQAADLAHRGLFTTDGRLYFPTMNRIYVDSPLFEPKYIDGIKPSVFRIEDSDNVWVTDRVYILKDSILHISPPFK